MLEAFYAVGDWQLANPELTMVINVVLVVALVVCAYLTWMKRRG